MFSKETARRATFILNSEVEKEFKMLMDDLISTETSRIRGNTPDADLRTIAIKKEIYEELKNYRQRLKDASGR